MTIKTLPESWRKILLGDNTSKQNKLWIAVTKKDIGCYWLEWKWPALKENISFQFEPDGAWYLSKSFDDVHRAMADANLK